MKTSLKNKLKMIRLKTINDISRLVGLCLVVCLIMVLIMNLYSLEKPSCNYRYSDISLPKGSLTQMIANPPPKKSENAERVQKSENSEHVQGSETCQNVHYFCFASL